MHHQLLSAARGVEHQAQSLPWSSCRRLRLPEVPDEQIYETDSSTEAKWSRHLVVRVPGHSFASNFEVSVFVRRVLADGQADQLLVLDEKGAHVSFVDMAVYSR